MMVWLGRRLVMDFGFGAMLEKFEQHYGSRAVKIILGLIGLAVALSCAKIIWTIALGPAIGFIAKFFGVGTRLAVALKIFWMAVAWVAGMAFSVLVFSSFFFWKSGRELRTLLSQAENLSAEASKTLEKAEMLADEAIRMRDGFAASKESQPTSPTVP
jgi:hypothetical protein